MALDTSLGMTDSKGSPFYAGKGKVVTEYDTETKRGTISIKVSDRRSGKAEVLLKIGADEAKTIELPCYEVLVTDDVTHKKTYYKIIRDSLIPDKEEPVRQRSFSLLGVSMFQKDIYSFQNFAIEPQNDEVEHFTLQRHRILKPERYIAFVLKNEEGTEKLLVGSGDLEKPLAVFENLALMRILDGNQGHDFIRDIMERERFMGMLPEIKMSLVKRKKVGKEYLLSETGKVDKIIYF
ncbi:hypothetical protein [Xanthovirga aplysinae]|uniref:hypothetical protein n=1 Tax=Xanthovirga aplysinae TaxID=2529853 RepID=UPI0012BCF6E0|nr:hypothetical protein [Xanthovirga aplysinae]MTI31220.1 hypothetical protein [Xanthovirga aplysinae]